VSVDWTLIGLLLGLVLATVGCTLWWMGEPYAQWVWWTVIGGAISSFSSHMRKRVT